MPGENEVQFDFTPNLARFEALLTRMPDVGEKEAKRLVKAVDRELGRVAKAAEKHARKARKETEEAATGMMAAFNKAGKAIQQSSVISNLETVGALGIQVGGTVSQLSSVFTSLVRPVAIVGSAFGATTVAMVGLGAALVALPVSAAAAAGAAIRLAGAAGEAGERLAEMGALAQEDAEFVTLMANASDASAIASDRLTVALAQSTSAIGTAHLAWTGFKGALADVLTVIGRIETDYVDWTATVLAGVGPLKEYNHALAETALRSFDAQYSLRQSLKALGEQDAAAAEAGNSLEDYAKKAKEASKAAADLNKEVNTFVGPADYRDLAFQKEKEAKAAKAAAEAKRKEAEAERELVAAGRKRQEQLSFEIEFEQEMRAIDAADRQMKFAAAWRETGINVAAAAAGFKKLEPIFDTLETQWEEWTREVTSAGKLTRDSAGLMVDGVGTLAGEIKRAAERAHEVLGNGRDMIAPYTDAISAMFELAQDRAEDAKDSLGRLRKENEKIRRQMARTDDEATLTSLRRQQAANEVMRAGQRKLVEERKRQARNLWAAEKAGNITEAGMNGAVAITQAFAQLGPIAGAAAAIGVGATTAAQIALIARQQPPKFHTGGPVRRDSTMAPDEQDIRIKHGEPYVVSQAQHNRLLDTLDRLDRALRQPREAPSVSVRVDRQGRASTSTTGRRNIHAARG